MGLTQQLQQTYQGKRVFITGHTGFKGTWLTFLLKRLGAKVKGYALAPENNSLHKSLMSEMDCTSIIADIRDLEKLKIEITEFQPDFIFHLAAQPLVRASYEQPLLTFTTNVIGTAHVLESLGALSKPCAAVFITTDKVYENPESSVPFKESDPLGGHDPYSASKAASEIVISSYRNSFFGGKIFRDHQKSISSARAGNVIGGGDWSVDRLVPDIVRALQQDREVVIRNPNAIRPWQHVLEPLTGYLILAMKQHDQPLKYNSGWNFGPASDHALAVKDVVARMIQLWGSGKASVVMDESKHEAQYLRLDISKAAGLGWRPLLSVEETLRWTITWYFETHLNPVASKKIIDQQIDSYFNLLA